MPPPRILVDADACPVKDEVLRVADRHSLVTVLVANSGLRPSRDPLVETVLVPQGADAADDWIVDNLAANDIVVTADIPLARRALEGGAHVLGPTGRAFTADSIGMALAMRDLNQQLRESGDSRGFNAAFTSADRSRFLSVLHETVQRAMRLSGG